MKYKYYLIDTQDIYKKIYEHSRRMVANDFVNDYDQIGVVNASSLFENLPQEYRKMIIKVPKNILKRKNATEYYESHPVKINIKRGNIAIGKDILYTDMFTWVDTDTLSINGSIKELTMEQSKMFYDMIEYNGYLKLYLEDLKNLFDYRYKPNKQLSMTKK